MLAGTYSTCAAWQLQPAACRQLLPAHVLTAVPPCLPSQLYAANGQQKGTYMKTLTIALPGGARVQLALQLNPGRPSSSVARLNGAPLQAGTTRLQGGGSVTFRPTSLALQRSARVVIQTSERS